MRPRDDVPALDGAAGKDYEARLPPGKKRRRTSATEMDALSPASATETRKNALMKFRAEIQRGGRRRRRSARRIRQIALMAEKQMDRGREGRGDEAARRQEETLSGTGTAARRRRAAPAGTPPLAMSVSDVGREAPPTFRLQAGDWRKPKERWRPGFPAFLGGGDAKPTLRPGGERTGRRSAWPAG